MRVISIHSVPRSGSTWLLSLFNSNKSKICFQPLFSYKFKDFLNIDSTKEHYNKFISELSNTTDSFVNMTNDFHKNNKKYFTNFLKKNQFH